MSELIFLEEDKIRSIFHPSDFSEASATAFAHALKVALVAHADLTMLHVAADHDVGWEDFPGVRETLERWNLLPEGSERTAIGNLGIAVSKVIAAGKDPVKASLAYLKRHHADLIVLASGHHGGRTNWRGGAVGEPLVRKAGQMTLFIPGGARGFVSPEDGSVTLRSMLIPVTAKPAPQPAVEAAVRLIRNLGLPSGTATLLHVGPAADMPAVKVPGDTGWTWDRATRGGEPAEVILQVASEVRADLILMTTDGPDGFLDALRGTISERVVRQARCPVANLPAGSLLG